MVIILTNSLGCCITDKGYLPETENVDDDSHDEAYEVCDVTIIVKSYLPETNNVCDDRFDEAYEIYDIVIVIIK